VNRNPHPSDGSEHLITRRRKQLGMTKAELARLAGVHRNYLADVEARRSSPTARFLARLAGPLACEPADLFEAERVAS